MRRRSPTPVAGGHAAGTSRLHLLLAQTQRSISIIHNTISSCQSS
jgi:hypothetical protein